MQIAIPRTKHDPLVEDAYEDDDDDDDDDDGDEVIDVKIIPSRIPSDSPASFSQGQSQAGETDTTTTTASASPLSAPQSPIRALFAAISTCSNLHPDLFDQQDHPQQACGANNGTHVLDADDPIIFEGSVGYLSIASPSRGPCLAPGPGSGSASTDLPPPMPGSGGWITADNVDDFFDSQGNWRGRRADDQPGPTTATGQGTRGDHRPGSESTGVRIVGITAHDDDHDEDENELDPGVHVHDDLEEDEAVDENDDSDGPPTSTKWRRTG